jgi:hypothetical protein
METSLNTKQRYISLFSGVIIAGLFFIFSAFSSDVDSDKEWVSLFNGEDLTGWVIPEGDGGHWKVVDGVIDYDAMSQAPGSKDLWSEKEYGDFVLRVDWRIKETPFINPNVPIILPDGSHKLDENGDMIRMALPDSDSGVYVRGSSKSQINIWSWPIGSGEVYGYRMDQNMPAAVRAGVTPTMHADNHIGEWNTFEITMVDEYLTVVLNGHVVIKNAHLPGVDAKGAIAFQHHGHKVDGEWASSPSLVQFRNIYIKEL